MSQFSNLRAEGDVWMHPYTATVTHENWSNPFQITCQTSLPGKMKPSWISFYALSPGSNPSAEESGIIGRPLRLFLHSFILVRCHTNYAPSLTQLFPLQWQTDNDNTFRADTLAVFRRMKIHMRVIYNSYVVLQTLMPPTMHYGCMLHGWNPDWLFGFTTLCEEMFKRTACIYVSHVSACMCEFIAFPLWTLQKVTYYFHETKH